MNTVTVLGDVHGEYDAYLKIAKQHDYTIQLGDMGFNYDHMDQLDPTKHKFGAGNHEGEHVLQNNPPKHFLGRYGSSSLNGVPFFWIGGEYSVDKAYRIPGRNWFDTEELSAKECRDCLQQYGDTKPDLVLAHGCPAFMIPHVVTNDWKLKPSMTAQFLQACYEIHQPKYFVFCHHHQSKRMLCDSTTFICLNELCYLDISVEDGILSVGQTKGQSINCGRNENFAGRNTVVPVERKPLSDTNSGDSRHPEVRG